jgi:hypothetical protein
MCLQDFKYDFKYARKRGSIKEYIARNGGYNGVISLHGSLKNFLEAMKKAGYSRSWVSKVKKKFKEQSY